jgi:general secretion pathway protein H
VHKHAGFTLVELMVVLALIGLAAAAVVLTMPAPDGGTRSEATRFAARVAALRDRAVIEGRAHGLWVTASGYGFERRVGDGWQPLDEGRLSRADWRRGTRVTVDGQPQGRLSFDRVGLPSRAMTVEFAAGDSGRARVSIDGAGEVAVR